MVRASTMRKPRSAFCASCSRSRALSAGTMTCTMPHLAAVGGPGQPGRRADFVDAGHAIEVRRQRRAEELAQPLRRHRHLGALLVRLAILDLLARALARDARDLALEIAQPGLARVVV